MKKHKKLFAIAMVSVAVLTLANSTLAAPPNNPPSSNVDASFNSTSYPDTVSPNIVIDSVAGIYSLVQSTLAELIVTGNTQLGNLNIDQDGNVSMEGNSPGTIVFMDKLKVQPNKKNNDLNTHLLISFLTLADGKIAPALQTFNSVGSPVPTWLSTGLYVDTISNPTAGGVPVKVFDQQGLTLGDDNGNISLRFAANGDISRSSGSSVIFNDGLTVYPRADNNDFNTSVFINSGTLKGKLVPTLQMTDDTGASAPLWASGGLAVNTVESTGQGVKFTDKIHLVNAQGNSELMFSNDGSISRTGSSPIQINHLPGLQIGNSQGTLGLKINGYGDITGPASTAVKITDSQGLQIANDAGTVGLSISANGDISTTGGNISAKNISATGSTTSTGGFGRIYTAAGTAVNITANTYSSAGTAYCAKTTDRVLSCSFSSSSDVLLADTYPSAYSCVVYVRNVSASTRSVTPKVTCIDPTGSPW